ncbi:4-hydroxythreonine-4-phosphate dehydrogenase PdxA [Oceanibacterium hippocampi]|uniref:4-hydroxythreonine-4-phosphate dehydrogenase n=1 Tax=Oceanibacterium hippocampi TaxID=745714 RepID=A0A1Y5STS6_9PROT|nr:4-hydroxythreonine-4-phosphate dehydrogenase PdxA [Oceanibacterium hippocampi]SLN48304.1 4-hydroxythreonine-4-phosphate dehydrogenase 1 [Oceanibacterium hippocampi]
MQDGARPLALTMGEPAGIGPEITLKAWQARRERALPPFVALADPDQLGRLAAGLGLDIPIAAIGDPAEAAALFDGALPVLALERPVAARPGRPDPADAALVLESIRRAVALAERSAVAGIVTNPINKAALYAAGFRHPGHTEYLAELTGGARPVMMLACPGLRVVPVTVHMALIEAAAALSAGLIVETGTILADALVRDFAISRPRIAIAGLNPHAGEGGALGREEIEIIAPAIAALRKRGVRIGDPAPADSLFHPAARARYDAVLCMYHDQALIPLKTIDFDNGVNITLGLPVIRTSPDHGTAFDIAGRGTASAASLIAALQSAAGIARNRARPGRTDNG